MLLIKDGRIDRLILEHEKKPIKWHEIFQVNPPFASLLECARNLPIEPKNQIMDFFYNKVLVPTCISSPFNPDERHIKMLRNALDLPNVDNTDFIEAFACIQSAIGSPLLEAAFRSKKTLALLKIGADLNEPPNEHNLNRDSTRDRFINFSFYRKSNEAHPDNPDLGKYLELLSYLKTHYPDIHAAVEYRETQNYPHNFRRF